MNVTRTIITTCAIIVLLSACSFGPKSEQEIMSEIYASVMAYEVSHSTTGNREYCKDGNLVVSSLTDNYSFDESDWEWVSNNFTTLEAQTWQAFLQFGAEKSPFPSDLDLGLDCEYVLLDVEENPPTWTGEECIDVYYFSKIAFNSDKDQALVYRSAICGDFAYGNLYFAEKVDGTWQVTDRAEVFVT